MELSCEEYDATNLEIDTEYFGVASAKILLKKACIESKQDELLAFIKNFEFVTLINKANNPFNNRWIGGKTKSFLMDINVQFHKRVFQSDLHSDNPTYIMDNLPKDDWIINIAKNSFKFSRFINDPYLPQDKAKHIYADITKNAFEMAGRYFILVKVREVIAGFLLFSKSGVEDTSRIELIAIAQDYERSGLGRTLIRSMENYVAANGIETIRVGTQLDNVSAMNFYTSYGFKILECNSVYHLWPHKN
jgi:dTDP-4-amino-4,6-dideoxy-D-galactose acyltransferase